MRLNLFQQPTPAQEHIDVYYNQMTQPLRQIIALIQDGPPRLEGRLEDERVLLTLQDVYYVETVDRGTFFYLEKQVYQADMTLREFLESFEHYGFARVNKSQIVNLRRVRCIRPTAGMRILAVLDNGEQLVINRSFRQSFEDALRTLGRNSHEKIDQ